MKQICCGQQFFILLKQKATSTMGQGQSQSGVGLALDFNFTYKFIFKTKYGESYVVTKNIQYKVKRASTQSRQPKPLALLPTEQHAALFQPDTYPDFNESEFLKAVKPLIDDMLLHLLGAGLIYPESTKLTLTALWHSESVTEKTSHLYDETFKNEIRVSNIGKMLEIVQQNSILIPENVRKLSGPLFYAQNITLDSFPLSSNIGSVPTAQDEYKSAIVKLLTEIGFTVV
jgi:hypothetical protein